MRGPANLVFNHDVSQRFRKNIKTKKKLQIHNKLLIQISMGRGGVYLLQRENNNIRTITDESSNDTHHPLFIGKSPCKTKAPLL